MERLRLAEDENERIFRGRILPAVLKENGYPVSVPEPRLTLVGGQPGAGKSNTIHAVRQHLSGNGGVLLIDVDELREFHPEHERLMKRDDRTAANYTHADASFWANKLEAYGREHRFNILLESTLKTPDNALAKLAEYREAGYSTDVRVISVNERSSWQGVLGRYEKQKALDGVGRMVPRDVHDLAYGRMLDTVHRIEAVGAADHVGVYDRSGTPLYENKRGVDGQWRTVPEMSTTLRRTREISPTARQWQQHIAGYDEISEYLLRPGRNAEPQELGDVRALKRASIAEGGLTAQVGLHPVAARGIGTAGIAATLYDSAVTGDKVAGLYSQDNGTGARSELLHFGSRNLGGWAGAVAGFKVGTLAGVESGPGMLATGALGGAVGFIAGERIAKAIDHELIYSQKDAAGNTWRFDPEQAQKGWTRDVGVGQINANIDPMVLAKTGGREQTRVETASAELSDRLNFQAVSKSVELALANPPQPLDPFLQPAAAGDTVSVVHAAWKRDGDTGTWQRRVVDSVAEHGIQIAHTESASPQRAAQLDHAAAAAIAMNASQSPAAMAERYQTGYEQFGWERHGPMPAAVPAAVQALGRTLVGSDGAAYLHQDGQWISKGVFYDSVASGNIKVELDATKASLDKQRFQRHQEGPRMVAPAATTIPQGADAEKTNAKPAAPDMSVTNTDARDNAHPDHALTMKVGREVERLEISLGRGWDEHSEKLKANLVLMAKRAGFTEHDDLQAAFNVATDKHAAGEYVFLHRTGPGASADPYANRMQMRTSDAMASDPGEVYRLAEQERLQRVSSLESSQVIERDPELAQQEQRSRQMTRG